MNNQQALTSSINKSLLISKLFIAWNLVFFALAFILRSSIAADAVGSVFLRGGFYAVGGGILVYLLKQMTQGKRSGWFRLSIIAVLAPIGVAAFIAFTPHLPMWFMVGQVGSGLMLAAIAVLILQKNVKQHFPKVAKS
jgi:hypothetical protein